MQSALIEPGAADDRIALERLGTGGKLKKPKRRFDHIKWFQRGLQRMSVRVSKTMASWCQSDALIVLIILHRCSCNPLFVRHYAQLWSCGLHSFSRLRFGDFLNREKAHEKRFGEMRQCDCVDLSVWTDRPK